MNKIAVSKDTCVGFATRIAEALGLPMVSEKEPEMGEFDFVIALYPAKAAFLRACDKFPHIKWIFIWVGSDAYSIEPDYDDPDGMMDILRRMGYKHYAVSELIVSELEKWDIHAEMFPLCPTEIPDDVSPLPDEYTVGVYYPWNGKSRRKWIYAWDDVKDIMNQTPDVKYIVYGNTEPITDAPPNAEVIGYTDNVREDVYDKITILLRYMNHDGFPQSMLEMGLLGKETLNNLDYRPYVGGNSKETIIYAIKSHTITTLGCKVLQCYQWIRRTREFISQYPMTNLIPPEVDLTVSTWVYVTPEGDRLALLERAIKSVDFSGRYEHVIVDDGSSVDIRPVVEKYPNVRYIRLSHHGIRDDTVMYRAVLRQVVGKYNIQLCSDDTFEPGGLDALYNYLETHPEIDVVAGKAIKIDRFSRERPYLLDPVGLKDRMLDANQVAIGSFMFRSSLFKRIQFPPDITGFAADYDLGMKLSEVGNWASLDVPIMRYNWYPDCNRLKPKDRESALKHIKYTAYLRRKEKSH